MTGQIIEDITTDYESVAEALAGQPAEAQLAQLTGFAGALLDNPNATDAQTKSDVRCILSYALVITNYNSLLNLIKCF